MCHINTKNKIMNQSDINSLVTGIIFRQCAPFKESQIKDIVLYHSAGAMVDIDEKEIEKLIRTRLDTLERNDYISCKKNEYYPKSIICSI